jgi:integrase/recombinase XerD
MVKSNQHRIIPMSDTVRKLLAGRRGENDLVFTGRNGQPLRKSTVSHMWAKIKAGSGVQGPTTPHSLRHTFATRALSNGMNIKYVQQALGHASVKTTERYVHVVGDDMAAAFQELNGHLSG